MWGHFCNLRIGTKLTLSFAVVGLLIAGAAVWSVQAIGDLREHLRIVYEDYTVAATDLAHVNANLLRYRNNIILAMGAGSREDYEKVRRQQPELQEKMVKSLDAYAATVLRVSASGRSESRDLEHFRSTLKNYLDAAALSITLGSEMWQADGEKEAASLRERMKTNAVSNAGPKLLEALAAYDELLVTVQEVAKDMNEAGKASGQRAIRTLVVGMMAAGIIGLALGLLVIRLITRSLTDIGAAAAKMAEGDYSARSTVSSTDEAGQLAQAFNQMSETLQQAAGKQAQALAAQAAEISGITNAIGKSQASIEFNLDGTILTANDNFCQAVGYRLEEIKGQHHRIFCDPAYTSSPEYTAFWAKLNRGEFDAGQYRRFGKGGKEIWIQASYNPVADVNGKICRVVKFATDITAQKKAQAELEACMAEAQQALGALAQGDLTREMRGAYQGELEKIKTSINGALLDLTKTLSLFHEGAQSVTTGSEEITKGNEDLSQRTSEQASALEETSASMEEMTSTVKQNADNARQANQLATAARDVAEKGGAVTNRAVAAMGEINNSSKKIADIITVIDEIAFQTNLLALNAAVEAARAGEHGRGFAVVAAEVRNLAQRSASAAKEIKGLINESIQRVNDGSDLVNQSGKTLEEIVNSVKRVTDIVSEIAAASQEQASGIDQVNKAIMQMDQTTQQNAALVEETTSASMSMKEQAKELLRQVGHFKLPGATGVVSVASSTSASACATAAAPSTSKPQGFGHSNGKNRRRQEQDFEEF